jgi:integrase
MSVLTDISVRNLKAPERGQKTYGCDSVRGFGCRVSQGGSKTFVLVHGDNRERTTIGHYPIISLAQAREEAKRILAERTLGKLRPKSVAWDVARDAFLKEWAAKNRPRTVADYTRRLKLHFPFGKKHLDEITYDDIMRRLAKLAKTPSEQSHAVMVVKIFLRWAHKPPRRYMPTNPTEGMTVIKHASRTRVLSEPELAAILRVVSGAEDPHSLVVHILAATGQRSGEVSRLQWSWINREEKIITFPGAVTKNHREHIIPYGRVVENILARVPISDSDYVFPASREHVRNKPTTTFQGWTKGQLWLNEKSGVVGWRRHDLRRTFATRLAEMGVDPHIIERLLNHVTGTLSPIALVYNRAKYIEQMRSAISLWDVYLANLLAP